MAIESLAAALEREHREIDEGIEGFTAGLETGTDQTAAFRRAAAALRRHIYLEEEFLFPPMRGTGLVAPVFVMVREHAQMWQTLDTLDAELSSGAASDAVLKLCQDLIKQLAAHNPKEEQILYPQADSVLNAAASAELTTFLQSGSMPENWVCEGRRG